MQAPLERLKAECAEERHRKYVFRAPAGTPRPRGSEGDSAKSALGHGGDVAAREVIAWHRLADFQLVSLKQATVYSDCYTGCYSSCSGSRRPLRGRDVIVMYDRDVWS